MIYVIQCAATKRPNAECLRLPTGEPIMFVAQPRYMPGDQPYFFAHPDLPFLGIEGTTGRELLLQEQVSGTSKLLEAGNLYANKAYHYLIRQFGKKKVYVLSAGWGLVRSDFLLPNYDITFTPTADRYKRRDGSGHPFKDFVLPSDALDEPIMFIGGQHYLNQFLNTTNQTKAWRYIIYNAKEAPHLAWDWLKPEDIKLVQYRTRTRTNWHYEFATHLARDELNMAHIDAEINACIKLKAPIYGGLLPIGDPQDSGVR